MSCERERERERDDDLDEQVELDQLGRAPPPLILSRFVRFAFSIDLLSARVDPLQGGAYTPCSSARLTKQPQRVLELHLVSSRLCARYRDDQQYYNSPYYYNHHSTL